MSVAASPRGARAGYNESVMVVRLQLFFVLLSVCAFVAITSPAYAQLNLTDTSNALTVAFSPLTPSPGDTVTVSVQSSLIDIGESDILWQADGKKIAQGRGVNSATVTVGALGTETRIGVTVVAPDGTSASTEAGIIPSELDLVADSDSYTPPFYGGWPRPSAGTTLHLQSFPRFKRGGTTLSASELIYTWRRNGEVLGTISGRGRATANIPVEHLFGTDTISVEARSLDNRLSQSASVTIPTEDPALSLYEDHPLYGVLYHKALPASVFILGVEATFAAVPFFAQARSMYDAALTFDWRVNSAKIPANPKNPSKITINAENSSGIALVELGVTHATNFYLDAKDAWNITFSSSGGGGVSDQFHQPASISQ